MKLRHQCCWPGCQRQVPSSMWGCREHWFRLPASIRARILATYKPAQEMDSESRTAHFNAMKQARTWIAEQNKAIIGPT